MKKKWNIRAATLLMIVVLVMNQMEAKDLRRSNYSIGFSSNHYDS